MPLIIEDASLRDARTIFATVTAFAVGVRALAVGVGFLLSRFSCAQGRLGLLLEGAALAVSFLAFSADSGLTVPIALASLAVALVVGWSLRSVHAIFVFVFILSSVVLPPLLSRSVIVAETMSDEGRWISAFTGQQAYVSSVVGPCKGSVDRALYVYYDGVHLQENAAAPSKSCTTLQAARPDPEALVAALASVNDGRAERIEEVEADSPALLPEAAEQLRPAPTGPTPQLLLRAISMGKGTVISGLNSHTAGPSAGWASAGVSRQRRDAVVLLGEGSELRDSLLHCRSPAESGASEPCVVAAMATRFRNVSFHVWDGRAGGSSAHVRYARTCEDLQGQLRSAMATEMGEGGGGAAAVDALVRCSDAFSASGAVGPYIFAALLFDPSTERYLLGGDDFLDRMPTLVAWRWYLPNFARHTQDALLYLVDTMFVPLGAGLVMFARQMQRWGQTAVDWASAGVRAATPYMAAAARHSHGGLLGLLCGDSARPWVAACVGRRRQPAFQLGAQVHEGVVAATAATLDALELIPGVWTLLQWGWLMEWTIVVGAVRGIYGAGLRLMAEVVVPAVGLAGPAARRVARRLPLLVGPLRVAAALVVNSSAGHTLHAGLVWVYEEELREMKWELAVLQRAAGVAGQWICFLMLMAWRALRVGVGACHVAMRLYTATSFSIQLVVIACQTALLLIAVRNEVRELVESEVRQQQRSAAEASPTWTVGMSFGSLTQSLTRRLQRSSLVSRVSGVVLFMQTHYYTCVRYVVTHLVLIVTLVGLSVLPLTGKLYALTLHFILPWMSTECFLTFFFKPRPMHRHVAAFSFIRVLAAVLLQRTIGELLYRLLMNLLIALVVFGATVVLVWAWPQRGFLARRLATAVSESLHNTPIRAAPLPPPAPTLSRAEVGAAGERAVSPSAEYREVAQALRMDEGAEGGAREGDQPRSDASVEAEGALSPNADGGFDVSPVTLPLSPPPTAASGALPASPAGGVVDGSVGEASRGSCPPGPLSRCAEEGAEEEAVADAAATTPDARSETSM